jgi:hypothetical protein
VRILYQRKKWEKNETSKTKCTTNGRWWRAHVWKCFAFIFDGKIGMTVFRPPTIENTNCVLLDILFWCMVCFFRHWVGGLLFWEGWDARVLEPKNWRVLCCLSWYWWVPDGYPSDIMIIELEKLMQAFWKAKLVDFVK